MMLLKRPKNRQTGEAGRKQGKIRCFELFSAMLSTETVDSFALAPLALSLQSGAESLSLGVSFRHDGNDAKRV
jgi:hypothetical protein